MPILRSYGRPSREALDRKIKEQAAGLAFFGAVGTATGRYTLGLIDVPISVAGQMYAEKELMRKLKEGSISVKDVTPKPPTTPYAGTFQQAPKPPYRRWELTDIKGNVVAINPDAVTEGTYPRDVGEALALLAGTKLTPEQRTAYQIGRFMGTLKPVQKVVAASTRGIPARPGLLRTFQAGLVGVTADTLRQVEEIAVKRQDSFSFESAWRTGGFFTAVGGVVEGFTATKAAMADARIINEFFRQHPEAAKLLNRSDLKAISAYGRAVQRGMSHKGATDVYGRGLKKIADKLDKFRSDIGWKPRIQKLLPTPKPKPKVPPTAFKSQQRLLKGDLPDKMLRDIGVKPSQIKVVRPRAPVAEKPEVKAALALRQEAGLSKITPQDITALAAKQPWEPPHVTDEGSIVSDELWRKHFREPGLGLYVTPKEYYFRLLGMDEIVQPITTAAKRMYLEQLDVSKWAKGIEKRINKLAKTSVKEKAVAKLMNRSTDPAAKMAVLLNKYPDAPDFLSPPEKAIFTEIRGFTRQLLHRTNMTRMKLGLEPIKEVHAYMTHWLDDISKQAVSRKYPFPHEVEYWLKRRLPRKIRNPLAEERKVKDDLLKYFSNNLGKLLSVMARYELRDIYLTEPYTILKAQMHELRKIIPAKSQKELDAYLRHDIFGYQTDLDALINTTLKPLTFLLNIPLKPTGRIITNPIRTLSVGLRRGIITATIAGRPRLAIRNLGQKLLLQNLYPQVDYLRAQFWKDPPGLMDMLRQEVYYRISQRRWEDIPVGTIVERVSMQPYQKAHAGFNYLSNVEVAMKTGWYYGQRMMKLSQDVNGGFYKNSAKRFIKSMPEHTREVAAKQIVAQKGSFYDMFKAKLWSPEDALQEATEAGSLTQWTYFMTDMPRMFRGHGARAMLSLQSWWQNYFFKHLRECWIRTFTGETSRGKYVRPVDRINWLKGSMTILGITEGIRATTGLDYKRFYFGLGPAPFYLPPLGQLINGTIRYMTAKSDRQRKQALSTLKYVYKAFVPGSMAWRDLEKFMSSEHNLKQYLFYTEEGEEIKKSVKYRNLYKKP